MLITFMATSKTVPQKKGEQISLRRIRFRQNLLIRENGRMNLILLCRQLHLEGFLH